MNQERIAQACGTIVLADSLADIHLSGHVPAWVSCKTGSSRYDLVSLPRLEAYHERTVEILAEDIGTAVSLHRNEKLLVYAAVLDDAFVDALKDRLSPLLEATLSMEAYEVGRGRDIGLEGSETLVISCMDWRLHGPEGGLIASLGEALGEDASRFDLLATAGGGKELTRSFPRWPLIRDKIRESGAKRVIVLSHTDCGKYGGSTSFCSGPHELAALTGDLNGAITSLIATETCLDVRCGIAQLDGDRVGRVILF